ncbi:MAG: hypothetical protein U0Y68_02045 [Blastocatellia bacterium]
MLVLLSAAGAQILVVDRDAHPRVEDLLQRGRAAIGNTVTVQSLTAKGTVRRNLKYVEVSSPNDIEEKEKTLRSKLRVEFLFPDKFRIREKGSQLNGIGYERTTTVNAHEAWLHPQPIVPSTPENRRVVSVEDAQQNLIKQAQTARANVTRLMLGWLLNSSASLPVEFAYAGRIASEVGANDVLSVRDEDGYKLLLLLDPQTHLPTMVNETLILPQRTMVLPTGFGFDRRFNRAILTRAREERLARSKAPQAISVQMRLSDRRNVGGLNLPHRITTYHNGQIVEEIEIHEFILNHPLDPKKFEENRPR